MLRRRRGIVAAFGGIGVALAASSWAWACTPQLRVFDMSTAAAPSGSEVTVTGQGQAGQVVEIRWNGTSGAKVAAAATASDGTFAAVATVPQVQPGMYVLALVSRDTGVGRAAFEVTPTAGSPTAAAAPVDVWSSADRSAAVPAQSSPGLVPGIILLGLGSAALFAGLVVAVVRRRPVPA
ncbi:MAG: hypothetical protein WKF86_00945 [Acidimicrobiales bacterium]